MLFYAIAGPKNLIMILLFKNFAGILKLIRCLPQMAAQTKPRRASQDNSVGARARVSNNEKWMITGAIG